MNRPTIILALSLIAVPAVAQEAPQLPATLTVPSRDMVTLMHYLETRPLGEVASLYSALSQDVQRSVEAQRAPPAPPQSNVAPKTP
jgi:hypothetical protein